MVRTRMFVSMDWFEGIFTRNPRCHDKNAVDFTVMTNPLNHRKSHPKKVDVNCASHEDADLKLTNQNPWMGVRVSSFGGWVVYVNVFFVSRQEMPLIDPHMSMEKIARWRQLADFSFSGTFQPGECRKLGKGPLLGCWAKKDI